MVMLSGEPGRVQGAVPVRSWRITQPWAEPADEREREALRKTQALMKKLQDMQEQKKREQ